MSILTLIVARLHQQSLDTEAPIFAVTKYVLNIRIPSITPTMRTMFKISAASA